MTKKNLNVSGIYCIKNVLTGRHYVGSSSKISSRKKSHFHLLRKGKHHSPILQRSWDRDGEAKFEFFVVEVVQDISNILEREQYWIETLNAFHPDLGFNVSPVAGTRRGVPHSDDSKKKMSAAQKGKAKSEEWKRKIGDASRGRPKSPETIEKIRAAAIRQFSNPDARAKAAEYGKMSKKAWKDKNMPDDMGRRFSEARKKQHNSSNEARMKCASNFPPEYRRSLSDDQVREIRARCARGERQRDVAADFGVCQPVISQIVTRKTYYDVD